MLPWRRLVSLVSLACLPLLASAAPLTGTFTAVDASTREATLKTADGREVKLQLNEGDAAIYTAGDSVSGDLATMGPLVRLQKVFPAEPAAVGQVKLLSEQLQRDTLQRGRKVFRNVGEKLPRFALWDESGDLFLSEGLRGKYVVLNFIFSRCPDPNMCPASTERMKALDNQLDQLGLDDVVLVSVTLDPDYDTPGIWQAYARQKGIDTTRHHLLSGPAETTRSLTQQLGVLAKEDEQQIIKHTMVTTLIDPQGTILYHLPGSMWSPDLFVKKIQEDRAK